jgi:tRNA (mo5U34)-methyltransferase
MSSAEELQAQVDSMLWFHSIDLGQGVKTKGLSELALGPDVLPDFAGKSVLDIGAWDGYYSYLAERAGAARVVALDHYAWGVDFGARGEYWTECFANGTLPDHGRDTTDFWRPDLPGRRGFEFAHKVLESKVEPVLADFTTTDLDALGTFDVVLYLGVLYHMKEPLTCLERLYAVTNEVAVIETEAIDVRGHEHMSLLQFHAGGDLGADFGNWYVPSTEALKALCRAAGFSRVEVKVGTPPNARKGKPPLVTSFRAVVHAFR